MGGGRLFTYVHKLIMYQRNPIFLSCLTIFLTHQKIPVVKVFSSQVSITAGGLDLEDSVLYGEDGHIEGSTTEVVDQHVLLSTHLNLM